MIEAVKAAVIGTGNNISALVQGIALHRATGSLVGVRTPVLDGLGVGDIEFVAAFAISPEKIGRDLTDAIFFRVVFRLNTCGCGRINACVRPSTAGKTHSARPPDAIPESCHTAWSCAGRRARQLPGHRVAGHRRPVRR
jgi:hypothetical protein